MANYKFLKFFIIIIMFLLFCAGLFLIRTNYLKKNLIAERVSTLGSFTSFNSEGAVYSFPSSNTKLKKYTIICFLSLDCDHCSKMIASLRVSKDSLANADILLVVKADRIEVEKFVKINAISELSGVTILNDRDMYLFSFFNVDRFPTIFLYNNTNRGLKARYVGEFNIELIIRNLI